MSEVERCPECGGLAGPDGVLSHGYVHVRHETGGGGMNRRCSQTPKPEEPTVVAGGGGYDPRALTALAKNRVLGNRREKVRMAGNAVTPCAARDLVAVVAEALS